MLIFISLFTHYGNQEWGVERGDQETHSFYSSLVRRLGLPRTRENSLRCQNLVEFCP